MVQAAGLVRRQEMEMVVLKRFDAEGFISSKAKVQTMPSGLHIAYISSRFKGEIAKMKKSGWSEY